MVVFGQIARDLVLVVDAMPAASQSAGVHQRRELLGGKGANQAVALAQLGMRPARYLEDIPAEMRSTPRTTCGRAGTCCCQAAGSAWRVRAVGRNPWLGLGDGRPPTMRRPRVRGEGS